MSVEEILVLSAHDVAALLTIEECITAVERAFRLYGEGNALAPAVLSLHVPGGGFHVKAGVLDSSRTYFAAKVNGNFPGNPVHFGLPTIQGVIALYDAEKGSPLAVMDSREVTSIRTAAASAVAAKYLARPDSSTLTICGCGIQGRVQSRAIAAVCRIGKIFLYDKNHEQAVRLSHTLFDDCGIQVTPVSDLADATIQSDICVTCTTSREPLLGTSHVRPGTFIAAVGADNPEKHEIHPALMASSKIVTDIVDQCAAMGDLHHALKAGTVTGDDVHAELGEIVAAKKAGRETDDEIIIFDSTGMALQDVAAAAAVYEKAQRQGLGIRLNLAA